MDVIGYPFYSPDGKVLLEPLTKKDEDEVERIKKVKHKEKLLSLTDSIECECGYPFKHRNHTLRQCPRCDAVGRQNRDTLKLQGNRGEKTGTFEWRDAETFTDRDSMIEYQNSGIGLQAQTWCTPRFKKLQAALAESREALICPITHDLMKDPVQAADGLTYERKAIVQRHGNWRIRYDMRTLIPNHNIKRSIDEYVGLSGNLKNVDQDSITFWALGGLEGCTEFKCDKWYGKHDVCKDATKALVAKRIKALDAADVGITSTDADWHKPNTDRWAKREKQKKEDKENKKWKLEAITCPISGQIMKDPVLAADGHTYERSEIERWLTGTPGLVDPNNKSPKTGAQLRNQKLVPNSNVKQAIHHCLKLWPSEEVYVPAVRVKPDVSAEGPGKPGVVVQLHQKYRMSLCRKSPKHILVSSSTTHPTAR